MAFKFVIFAAVVAVARAGVLSSPLAYSAPLAPAPLAYAAPAYARVAAPIAPVAPLAYAAAPIARVAAAPVAVAAKTVVADEYDPNPQYSYGYDVQDALTGDSKSQVESRSGDVVQGSYSLNDADGTRRTVDYTADPINGFNAVVRKEPLAVAAKAVVAAPAVAKIAAPVAYSAPAIAAPLAYAAPAAHISYAAAPAIAKVAAPLSYAAPAISYASPAFARVAATYGYGASAFPYAAPAFAKIH